MNSLCNLCKEDTGLEIKDSEMRICFHCFIKLWNHNKSARNLLEQIMEIRRKLGAKDENSND